MSCNSKPFLTFNTSIEMHCWKTENTFGQRVVQHDKNNEASLNQIRCHAKKICFSILFAKGGLFLIHQDGINCVLPDIHVTKIIWLYVMLGKFWWVLIWCHKSSLRLLQPFKDLITVLTYSFQYHIYNSIVLYIVELI